MLADNWNRLTSRTASTYLGILCGSEGTLATCDALSYFLGVPQPSSLAIVSTAATLTVGIVSGYLGYTFGKYSSPETRNYICNKCLLMNHNNGVFNEIQSFLSLAAVAMASISFVVIYAVHGVFSPFSASVIYPFFMVSMGWLPAVMIKLYCSSNMATADYNVLNEVQLEINVDLLPPPLTTNEEMVQLR